MTPKTGSAEPLSPEARRRAIVEAAHLILVMEHGQIVEQGGHEQLIALDGAHAQLYNSQFAGADLSEMSEAY